MKIAVASDHGGFALKELVKKHLEERGAEVLDLGTHSEESVDYPIYGKRCPEAVCCGVRERGKGRPGDFDLRDRHRYFYRGQ